LQYFAEKINRKILFLLLSSSYHIIYQICLSKLFEIPKI